MAASKLLLSCWKVRACLREGTLAMKKLHTTSVLITHKQHYQHRESVLTYVIKTIWYSRKACIWISLITILLIP